MHKELQRQKDALIEERSLLRTLIDTLPDLIYIKDREHRFLVVNSALTRYMGFTRSDELIGKSDVDILPQELASRYYEDERTVLESGEPLVDRVEPGLDQHTGEKKWFLSTKVPFFDRQGNIKGIIGIGRDITKSIKEKEALQELVSTLSWENLFLNEHIER